MVTTPKTARDATASSTFEMLRMRESIAIFNIVKRIAHIGFLALLLFFAATPWVVIHTCGGETDVDLMSASAEDPCGCADDGDAAPCCSLEVRTFHLDAARPAVSALPGLDPDFTTTLFPAPVDLPMCDFRHAPAGASVHPPGHPPLQILHCALLV